LPDPEDAVAAILLFIAGGALLVAGAALVSIEAGLIVAGVLVMGAALDLSR
jgi:hypothetical protein